MSNKSQKPVGHVGPPPSESEYSFALTRIAVAQICQSVGFKGAQNPALEALTDIATRYLKAAAKLGAASANSNGRTESNLPDIIAALEELASVQGFPGSSSLGSCSLYTSPVIKDLMKFVNYTDEIPFAQPLPRRRGFDGKWKFSSGREDLRHVPRWLPDVPVVEEKEKKEEDEGKRKWGLFEDGRKGRSDEENGKCCVEKEGNKEIEVSGKRGKVRFKMGRGASSSDLGGMVRNLRFGGIGKRVVCGGGENESERTALPAARKKPR